MLKAKALQSLCKGNRKLVFAIQRLGSSEKHAEEHEHHGYEPAYKYNMGPYPFPVPHEHHEHYDFRDDPNCNDELSYPTGFTRDVKWKFPFEAKDDWYFQGYEHFDPYDPKQAFLPYNTPKNYTHPEYQPPYVNYDEDEAHEFDYGSEDLDFQPDSYYMQHFRKKGPVYPVFLLLGGVVAYVYLELYGKGGIADEDYWKTFVRPPPLDFPDEDDTPDTEVYETYNSKGGRRGVDTGKINPLQYDIIDGKKVYKKFVGLNPPMPVL